MTPTISLLSAIGLVIAFGLCVAAGLFLVRRRTDEAHVLFTRGEAATVFAARTGLEALLPALAGDHEVTAVSRSADEGVRHTVRWVRGDVEDVQVVPSNRSQVTWSAKLTRRQ